MTTFWTQAFSVWMQSFDSRLHDPDMLAFIHDVPEIKPVQVQTPDTTENNSLCAMGMNGPVSFDVKPGIIKKELLTGILHKTQRVSTEPTMGPASSFRYSRDVK